MQHVGDCWLDCANISCTLDTFRLILNAVIHSKYMRCPNIIFLSFCLSDDGVLSWLLLCPLPRPLCLRLQYKPPSLKKPSTSAASAAPAAPSTSTRLPQRAGLGQPTGELTAWGPRQKVSTLISCTLSLFHHSFRFAFLSQALLITGRPPQGQWGTVPLATRAPRLGQLTLFITNHAKLMISLSSPPFCVYTMKLIPFEQTMRWLILKLL